MTERGKLNGTKQEVMILKSGKQTFEDPIIPDVEDLASATECTGLTPASVQTPEEAEAYTQLYNIHEQKTAWKKETNGKPIPRKEQREWQTR